MKKRRIFAYMGLVVVPLAAACSVGTDNKATYFVTGKLRQEVKESLSREYWPSFKDDVKNPTENLVNIYEALLKETGIGVTFSYMKLHSIWENGASILQPFSGDGLDESTRVLYDCQSDKPINLTDEEKENVKAPNATKCNEKNDEIKPYLSTQYQFRYDVTYIGSEYPTANIKHKEEVPVCVVVEYENTDSLEANIIELLYGKC